jgi:hypothetical protein
VTYHVEFVGGPQDGHTMDLAELPDHYRFSPAQPPGIIPTSQLTPMYELAHNEAGTPVLNQRGVYVYQYRGVQ